jgi:hypothetical protein
MTSLPKSLTTQSLSLSLSPYIYIYDLAYPTEALPIQLTYKRVYVRTFLKYNYQILITQ